MRTKKLLFFISSTYISLLIVSIILMFTIIPSFTDVGHLKQGCYFTDAMVPYIKCTGFWGYEISMLVLNIPYQLIYLPLFGVLGFSKAPWLILLAILIWLPIAYFFWYVVKMNNELTKI